MRVLLSIVAVSALTLACSVQAEDRIPTIPAANFKYLPPIEKVETIFRPGESVLVVGDSLVVGKGVSKEKSFPVLFDQLTVARVTGEGKSGETSSQLLRRLPSVVRKQAFRWVIVCIGANDSYRDQVDGKLRSNLIEAIREIRSAQAHPVLIAIPDPRTMIDFPVYREVGATMRVPVVEGLGTKLGPRNFLPDGVHPNAEGYKKIAVALMHFFAKSSVVVQEASQQKRPTSEINEAPAEVFEAPAPGNAALPEDSVQSADPMPVAQVVPAPG